MSGMMGSAAIETAQQVAWVTHGTAIAPCPPSPVNGFVGVSHSRSRRRHHEAPKSCYPAAQGPISVVGQFPSPKPPKPAFSENQPKPGTIYTIYTK